MEARAAVAGLKLSEWIRRLALGERQVDQGSNSAPAVRAAESPVAPRASVPKSSVEPPAPKKDPLADVPGLRRGSEVPYRKPFVPRPKGS
jgi:hypothetical protein